MQISLRGKNIKEFETKMGRFANALEYNVVKDASDDIRALFFKAEKELFNSEGGSGSHGSWPELSPEYKKWKNRHYPGQKIMVLKGGLKRSLTSAASESIFIVSKSANRNTIKLGTDIKSKEGFDYPVHHQEKAKKIRRIIDPKGQTAKGFIQILQREMWKAARKSNAFDRVTAKIGQAEFDKGVPG